MIITDSIKLKELISHSVLIKKNTHLTWLGFSQWTPGLPFADFQGDIRNTADNGGKYF